MEPRIPLNRIVTGSYTAGKDQTYKSNKDVKLAPVYIYHSKKSLKTIIKDIFINLMVHFMLVKNIKKMILKLLKSHLNQTHGKILIA